jgi:hypothetical protein
VYLQGIGGGRRWLDIDGGVRARAAPWEGRWHSQRLSMVGGGGAAPSPCAGWRHVVAMGARGSRGRRAGSGAMALKEGRRRSRQRQQAATLGTATTGGGTESSSRNDRRRRGSLRRGPPVVDLISLSVRRGRESGSGFYTPQPLVPVGSINRD